MMLDFQQAVSSSYKIPLIHKEKTFFIPEKVKAISGSLYEVGEEIAKGGNAVVHHCMNILDGEKFAIKFQVMLNNNRKQRFDQEVNLLKIFKHPHIISYVDHGSINGLCAKKGQKKVQTNLPFVVLRKASDSLSGLVRSKHQIPQAVYLGQFIGLAKALTEINKHAIHRDIKPENILVIGDSWVISDFGLCDIYSGGLDLSGEYEKIGPIYWMSPEALNKHLGNKDMITQISDVFQLASVFWYVACGRHPSGIVDEKDWKGPEKIYNVLRKALMHDPNKRFKSSTDFYQSLIEEIGFDNK